MFSDYMARTVEYRCEESGVRSFLKKVQSMVPGGWIESDRYWSAFHYMVGEYT